MLYQLVFISFGTFLPVPGQCHFFGKLLYDLTLDQHCRCFTNQGEGAADLLEALGRCQELEDVNFAGCYGIPAAAWQQLRGVKWPRLKKANFGACLARERKLVEGVFVFFHSVYRVLYVQYLSWQDSSSSGS